MSRSVTYNGPGMKLRQLVLVVEPGERLAQLLLSGLQQRSFEVTTAKRGADALRAALSSDVIVANIVLPDMAGSELRRAIQRDEGLAGLPLVLFQPKLAVKGRPRFVVDPDLYASKPVSLPRFCQRVSALSRPRAARVVPEVCEAGMVRVDTIAHRVLVGGVEIALTALEFRLLVTFVASKDRVLSREQLLRDVWGIRAHANTRTIDTNVKRLRQKLGPAAPIIETIRDVGYRFVESGVAKSSALPLDTAGSAKKIRTAIRSRANADRARGEA
jgi:two-component system, OmpR family, phosphate regulon response regulator PhoB